MRTAKKTLFIFISEDRHYAFNAMEGRLSLNDQIQQPLPPTAYDDIVFKRLFVDGPEPLYKKLTPNAFESLDGMNRFHVQKGKLVVQRKLDARHWYQYSSPEALPKALLDAFNKPVFWDSFTHWTSCNDQEEESLLFVDLTPSFDVIYTMNLFKGDEGLTIKQIVRKDGLKIQALTPETDSNSFMTELSRVEDPICIHLLGLNNELRKIELPRLNLGFQIKAQNGTIRAYSTELTDFYLAHHQGIRGMEGFINYLVLENGRGAKKVIIPNRDILTQEKGALSSFVGLSRTDSMAQEANTHRYFSYDVDKNGRLRTDRAEENLYMATILLAKKEYEKAGQYFRSYVADAKKYSPLADELFKRIAHLRVDHRDGAPKASAVYLLAVVAYCDNKEAYDQSALKTAEEIGLFDGLKQDYLNYLTLLDEVTTLKLLPQEELFIIRHIDPDPRMIARAHVLEESPESDLNKIDYSNPHKKNKTDSHGTSLHDSVITIVKAMQNDHPTFTDVSTYPFLRPGKVFQENFILFYQWAKGDDPSKRLFIKEALRLMRHDNAVDPHLRDYMQAVWEDPDRFPDVNHFLHGDKVLESIEHTILNQQEKEVALSSHTAFSFGSDRLIPPIKKERAPLSPKIDMPRGEVSIAQEIGHELSLLNALSPHERPKLKARLAMLKSIEYRRLYVTEAAILSEINKEMSDWTDEQDRQLEIIGTQRKAPTINDMIPLFLRQNAQEFMQLNPSLTLEDVRVITEKLYLYFEASTRRQQLDRALSQLEWMDELESTGILESDPILQSAQQKFKEEITSKRAYVAAEHPECLVFESLAEIMIRPLQIDNFEKMLPKQGISPNIILQMNMGAGKSKVILPLWALKKADGDRLPIIVVPESLYETTVSHLRERSGSLFSQKTITLELDRSTDFSVKTLSRILRLLEYIRSERDYLIITPKSLQCLRLNCREALIAQAKAGTHASRQLNQSIDLARAILTLIKTKGDAIIDEADTILNCRQEVNFTVGQSGTIHASHTGLVVELYRAILSIPSLRESLISRDASYSPIIEATYHASLKKELLERFLNPCVKSPLTTFVRQLSEEDRETMTSYLLGGKDPIHSEWIKNQEESARDWLSILHEELNTLLPMTLSRSCDVHYGLGVSPDKPLAVPYHGNNTPSLKSEFGNHYEIINYTIQTYMNKDIPTAIIEKDIRALQRFAMDELQNNKDRPIEQTAAFKVLVRIYGESVAALGLMRLGSQKIAKIAQEINTSIEKKLNFVEQIILSELVIPSAKLNANPLGLVDLFSSCQGFTGTPWNSESFNESLTTLRDEETEAHTTAVLRQKCSTPESVRMIHDAGFPTVLHTLFNEAGDAHHYRAFMDTGALFHGVSNEAVARELLAIFANKPINGVIFMKGDEPYILEKSIESPIPLSKSALTENERFTYYDQRHCIGIDIKQAPFASAFATIGKDSTRYEVFQGAYRMRDIEKNQTIVFLVNPETVKIAGHNVTDFEQVLTFLTHNENAKKTEHIITSTPQKIRHAVINEIEALLIYRALDFETRQKIALRSTHLLCLEMGDHPYQRFGSSPQSDSTQNVIANFIQEMKRELSVVLEILEPSLKKEIEEHLAIQLAAFQTPQKRVLLPKTLPSFLHTNQALQQEVMTEVKQEVQQEVQQQTETESIGYRLNARPLFHWSWGSSVYRGHYRKPLPGIEFTEALLQPTLLKGGSLEERIRCLAESSTGMNRQDHNKSDL